MTNGKSSGKDIKDKEKCCLYKWAPKPVLSAKQAKLGIAVIKRCDKSVAKRRRGYTREKGAKKKKCDVNFRYFIRTS